MVPPRTINLNVNDVINKLKASNTRLSAVTSDHDAYGGHTDNTPMEEWGWLASATGGEVLDIASSDYGASLTYIAQKTADAAGATTSFEETSTATAREWRNILTTDNGFELGSAFVKDIYIQSGTKSNQAITISLYDHISTMLKLNSLDLTTRNDAIYAREALDVVIQKILDHSTEYGVLATRLDMANDNITTAEENTTAAESAIRDADMAKAMVAYTKNNLILQAAQSMLAQANQSGSNVLSLL